MSGTSLILRPNTSETTYTDVAIQAMYDERMQGKDASFQNACADVIQKGDLSLNDFIKITPLDLNYLFSPQVIQAIRDGIFEFKDIIGGMSDTLPYITCVEVIDAMRSHVFDLLDICRISADAMHYILSVVGIQAIRNRVFELQDLKHWSLDELAHRITPEYIQLLRDRMNSNHVVLASLETNVPDVDLPDVDLLDIEMADVDMPDAEVPNVGTGEANAVARNRLDQISFDTHFNTLRAKAHQMRRKAHYNTDYRAASTTAYVLYHELWHAKRQFLIAADPCVAERVFVEACVEAVNHAKPVLETHRGWSEVLSNVVNALLLVLTLGMSYVVTGRFRLFDTPTDSATKLAAFEQCIEALRDNTTEQAAGLGMGG